MNERDDNDNIVIDTYSDESCSGEARSVSSALDADLVWIPNEDDHHTNNENEEEEEEEEEEKRRRHERGDIPQYISCTFSSILAKDIANQNREYHEGNIEEKNISSLTQTSGEILKNKICCICKDAALYTCPGCGARTCSITCVRVHKEEFNCSGERDIAKKVPLSEFSDRQLQRDYHFLEDVKRVVDNCERTFPKMWRYTFRALPPPLHALREAAKKRGVVCQITSEGMAKRDANTSRFDKKTETITWRCQFNFHDPDFSVSTDWGSERHRIGDIVTYCWATKPPLPCFHINRKYNRASDWIGAAEQEEKEKLIVVEEEQEREQKKEEEEEEEELQQQQKKEEKENQNMDETLRETSNFENMNTSSQIFLENPSTHLHDEKTKLFKPSQLTIKPLSPEETHNERMITSFLSMEPVIILARAERLGSQRKYFRLSPSSTLNDALRTLFFVNEFPVFDVIHASHLEAYPLVTDADKESIRESFRMAPRPPKPEKQPRRTKSDLSQEEIERYARVPCRMYRAGRCPLNMEACPYWHCEYAEIPACRGFAKFAACEKGARCSFRHDPAAVGAARKRAREERQQSFHHHHHHHNNNNNNNNRGGRRRYE